jgi:membrane fusion protein, multidrug efflux system
MHTNTKKSIYLAAGVAVAVTAWMLSGLGREAPPPDDRAAAGATAPGAEKPRTAPLRVSVRKSVARTVTREIVVSARTEPNRGIELRAETDGRVVNLGVDRGAVIAEGDSIVNLDLRDRSALIEEAKALIAQRELQYQAARRLEDQKLISQVQIAEARTALENARALLEQREIDLRNTAIIAPFDAVLFDRLVEVGDYVQAGDAVAELVDIDPLLIVGEINERDIGAITIGGAGSARLVGGNTVEGRVRYLAPVADEGTRTFRVELAVPNPSNRYRAGTTAEMRLAGEEITAHFLSAALLTLDDLGNIGIKAVDEFDRVAFHPVTLVSTSGKGVSVVGLPNELRIITVGQGFVSPGQAVVPVVDPSALEDGGNISGNVDDLVNAERQPGS